MKCARCKHDSKHRERSDGRCPKCHQVFAFEPQNRDPLTDLAFQAAIDKVSANGSVRFGLEHLRYEVLRRVMHKQRAFAVGRSQRSRPATPE